MLIYISMWVWQVTYRSSHLSKFNKLLRVTYSFFKTEFSWACLRLSLACDICCFSFNDSFVLFSTDMVYDIYRLANTSPGIAFKLQVVGYRPWPETALKPHSFLIVSK